MNLSIGPVAPILSSNMNLSRKLNLTITGHLSVSVHGRYVPRPARGLMGNKENANIDFVTDNDTLFYIFGLLGAIVCIFGIFCNVVNLLVFGRRQSKQKACTVFFTTLSVFDLAHLLTFLIFGSIQVIIDRISEEKEPVYIATELHLIDYLDGLCNIFVTGSVYTTVALMIDRYVAVSRPFQWSFLCSKQRSWCSVLILTLSAVTLNIPLFLERSSESSASDQEIQTQGWAINSTVSNDVTGSTTSSVIYRDADVSSETIEYVDTFFHNTIYLKVILPIFVLFGPAIVIFISTCGIVINIRRNKVGVATESGNDQSQATKRISRVTIQVIVMAIATLTANGMQAFSFFIVAANDTVYIDQCSPFCVAFVSISNVCLALNSGVNMILFCCYSKSFREDAKAILLCGSCSREKNITSSSGTKESARP